MDLMTTKSKIFAGLLKSTEEDTLIRRQEFLKKFTDMKVFEDEYFIFAHLVKEHTKLSLSKKFIKSFMMANRAVLEKSQNISFQRYKITNDSDSYIEFVDSCLGVYDELQKESFTNAEFLEELEIYKINYINEGSIQILEESVQILTEGVKIGGKNKVGYDDMRVHLKTNFQVLDALTEQRERKGLITYGVNDEDDMAEDQAGIKRISKYGIDSLDKHVGGIWEGEMVSLLAPAKGGKSRMATYILHQAIISGVNVLMWSIENGYKGWEALLRARHFEYFVNELNGGNGKRVWVDDDAIRKGDMSDEIKALELASWTDLRTNKAYGKITSVDDDFDIDNYLEVVDSAVKMNGIKLICIDYLQLVQGSGRASKNERVSEVYQKTLQYLKGHKIAGVFPGQLKQTATGSLSKMDSADIVNTEMRDAAGESYEVIKTPDVNLVLYATVEELKAGRIRLLSIPSRNHKQFDPIEMSCSLGSCTFLDNSTMGKP